MWVPLSSDQTHPAETPRDEATATKRWKLNERGPRLARIKQVFVLVDKRATKPLHISVIEDDVQKEVPKHLVLHEREGFLIIQELLRREGDGNFLHAEWLDSELRLTLEKHSQGKVLPCAGYFQKVLIQKAVTGAKYVDDNGREISYRRDMSEKDAEELPPGVERDGYFCIKELAEYMPPWEAFCHAKCGFYQDFYKVRWAEPYDINDYAQIENGCIEEPGCTWEPDESLPPCLDNLRCKAKKEWFAAQVERETQAKRSLEERQPQRSAKRLRGKDRNIQTAQRRRDNKPLEADLLYDLLGHDLVVEQPDKFPSIRKGWPLRAQDYPPNYSVATPPGFCKETCDCMDDQRGQQSWEVMKGWIDKKRGTLAQAALDHFTAQSNFVRARGAVSGFHYFETSDTSKTHTPAQHVAAELSVIFQGILREACAIIPIRALTSESDPLYLPARAIISVKGNCDYIPLRIDGNVEGGGPLPSWLLLDAETGLLYVESERQALEDVKVQFHMQFSEGTVKTFSSTISRRAEAPTSLAIYVQRIKNHLKDPGFHSLDRNVRAVLDEQLAQIANNSLGKFVQILGRCQNLLRSTAVAYIVPARRTAGIP